MYLPKIVYELAPFSYFALSLPAAVALPWPFGLLSSAFFVVAGAYVLSLRYLWRHGWFKPLPISLRRLYRRKYQVH